MHSHQTIRQCVPYIGKYNLKNVANTDSDFVNTVVYMIKIVQSTARMTNANTTHKPHCHCHWSLFRAVCGGPCNFYPVGLQCRPGQHALCKHSLNSATHCRLLAIRFSCTASASNHN